MYGKLPPPPAFTRPGTGMDFGLAFMETSPQTVNLACKHSVIGAREYWSWFQELFCYFLRLFGKVFKFVNKAKFEVHSQTKAAYLGCRAVKKTSIIRMDSWRIWRVISAEDHKGFHKTFHKTLLGKFSSFLARQSLKPTCKHKRGR